MTSDECKEKQTPSPAEPEPKYNRPIAGGRCSKAELYLIDRAALEVGQKRGHFVVQAALEKARKILGMAA